MERDDVAGMIGEYVLDLLPPPRRAEVEQALAADEDLRRFAEFVAWLRPRLQRLGDDVRGAHPAGQELVAWALDGADPDGAIGVHVASCAECRELATAVREAHAGLERPSRTRSPRAAWPWVAAAALAVAAFGLGYGLGDRDAAPRERGGITVARLEGVTRGDAATREVVVDRDATVLVLALEGDPWAGRPADDDVPAVARLVAVATGATRWELATTAHALWSPAQGAMLVPLPVRGLVPGEHELQIATDDGVIATARFRLTLR